MKRLVIGIVTLSLLFSAGLFVASSTQRLYQPIITLLEDATQNALKDNFPQAVRQAAEAKAIWDSHKKKTATVADHTPMEDIDLMFAEAEIYAKTEETPHFAACCAQLASMVQNMADAHAMNLWNLL